MLSLVAAAIPVVGSLLEKVLPDPEAQAKAKLELMKLAQEGASEELKAVQSVVVAEAKSDHWIVAAWRPITMLTFTAIIANNYILAPYLNVMFGVETTLPIPPDMWGLIKVGLGGYVVGRSAEKAVKAWKDSEKGSK
jgi:hypothetical protein